MKKVLFATTALVASAGVASADVAVSGSAEMGIVGGERYNNDTQFLQSVDVRFAMTGTADNGLSFGATVDLDDSQDTAVAGRDTVDSRTFSDFTVFISGELGTLTMGDTDGALDWAMQEVNIGSPGSIDDSETWHAGFNGNSALDGWYDGQVLRYDYSFGDFAVAISATQDDNSSNYGFGFDADDVIDGLVTIPDDNNNADVTGDPIWAIGGTYSGAFAGGTFGVGAGYQFTNDGLDQFVGVAGTSLDFTDSDEEAVVWGLSADVTLDNGFSAAINYSSISLDLSEAVATGLTVPDGALGEDFDVSGTHVGIGASYTFDAITVHANYGQYDWDSDANNLGINDASGYGLAAAYDFGGGLSAHLGYGYSDVDSPTVDDSHSWSLGMAMSF